MAIITTSQNITGFIASSTTAMSTAPASKTITVDTGKSFYPGMLLTVDCLDAQIPTRVRGIVTTYDSGTGVLVFSNNTTQWVEGDALSTTSLLIGTGSKTLTTSPGLGLSVSDSVRIQQIGALRAMTGTVTAYDNVTGVLTVNVTATLSSGTVADWTVCSEGTFSDLRVTYQQADIIEIRDGATLTVSATPPTRFGTVQCITSGKLRIENSSTSVPLLFNLHDMNNDLRFEAGGVLEIRGAAMSLASGTGAAQTWDFTSLFGGVIRNLNYVEVEETAGSGVFMPWPVVPEDPKFNLGVGNGSSIGGATDTAFTAGNTYAGQALFWHETNRTLRCGNNTNGRAVPSGCAVRIPNIFISNRLLTNQTTAFNVITSGTPTGGTFTIEISRESGAVIGTTAPIAFNATAAAIDTAVEAITGAGTVTAGTGPLPAATSVTWAGSYANERLGVRIANNSLTGGTNPQVYVYESNPASLSLVDLSPLGTMDAEWCCFSDKFRISTDTFKSARLVNVGIGGDSFQLTTSNGSVEINGLNNCRSPFAVQSASQVTSVLGIVAIQRVVVSGKSAVGFNLNVVPAISLVDKVTAMFFGVKNSTSVRSLQLITLPANLKITNIASIGAPFNFTNLTNCSIVNFRYADSVLNTQQTTVALGAMATTNCVSCTFANYSDAGPASARNTLLVTDSASSNLKFLGISSDLSNNSYAALSMSCGGAEVSNVSVANVRTGPLIDLPSTYLANNLIAKKLFATFATAQATGGLDACQGGQYDLVSSSIAGITETFSGVNDFVGGNYTDPSLTPTTGHVTFGPFGAGAGLELTGSAYTDALGAFLLPASGDTAVVTMPFAMHGITSFQNVNPYLYIDSPGAAANISFAVAPGIPTGGTFTLTFADSSGTVLGTTTALAFNASATTVSAAVSVVLGLGNHVTAGTSIGGGYSVTGAVLYAGQGLIMSVDGSALTGGAEPGVAYAYGRARLQTGTELLGSITPVEFAVRVPGTSWPAYAALTGANLSGAIAALTGYAAGGSGLEMRIKVTATQTNPYTKFNQISLPTNVNPALWTVGDATVTLQGPAASDVTTILRASDNAALYTFTGSGVKEFTVGANFDVEVYFCREDSMGNILMKTRPATQRLNFGNNGTVSLFYGMEVQLAQSSDVAAIKTAVDAYLDAAISSRLATAGYTAPANSDITAIKAKTDRLTFNVSDHLAANVHQIQAGPVADIQDGLALEATSQSIKTKTDALPSDPADESSIQAAIAAIPAAPSASTVASAVRTELATELGRVDVSISTRNSVAPLDSTATQAAVAAALTAYDPPTKAELDAAEADIIAALPVAAPSASTVASAVRTELSTELARVDVAISTRNDVEPDNAGIAAIKTNTDLIPAAL